MNTHSFEDDESFREFAKHWQTLPDFTKHIIFIRALLCLISHENAKEAFRHISEAGKLIYQSPTWRKDWIVMILLITSTILWSRFLMFQFMGK